MYHTQFSCTSLVPSPFFSNHVPDYWYNWRPSTHSFYDRQSILVSKWLLFLPQLLISSISSSFLVMWSFSWNTVMNGYEMNFDRQREGVSEWVIRGTKTEVWTVQTLTLWCTKLPTCLTHFFLPCFQFFNNLGWPNYYSEINWIT